MARPAAAQPPPDGSQFTGTRSERFEALRVAFITQHMELTPEEAERFWPVYNEFRAQDKRIQVDLLSIVMKYKSPEGRSPAELKRLGDDFIRLRQEEADLRTAYHSRFKEVLSAEKVARLYIAELKFKREMLEMLRQRMQRMEGDAGEGPGGRFRRW